MSHFFEFLVTNTLSWYRTNRPEPQNPKGSLWGTTDLGPIVHAKSTGATCAKEGSIPIKRTKEQDFATQVVRGI